MFVLLQEEHLNADVLSLLEVEEVMFCIISFSMSSHVVFFVVLFVASLLLRLLWLLESSTWFHTDTRGACLRWYGLDCILFAAFI